MPVGALIAGAAALQGFNTITNMANNAQNRQFQREMWEDQKLYNTSEREAAQQYNTSERLAVQDYNAPVAQMQRLLMAGINPNTAAGMVSSPNSNPQSITGASASPSFSDMPNPFGDLFQAAQMTAQNRLVNAQADKQEIENQYLDDYYQLNNKQIQTVIDNVKQDTAYKKILAGKTEQEKKQIETLLPLLARQKEAELEQLAKAISLTEEQIRLTKEKVQTEESAQAANYASANANNANADITNMTRIWKENLHAVGIDPDSEIATRSSRLLFSNPDMLGSTLHNVVETVKSTISTVRSEMDKVPSYAEKVFPFLFNK